MLDEIIRNEILKFFPDIKAVVHHCAWDGWDYTDETYKVRHQHLDSHKEEYFKVLTNITTGICPDCLKKHYPRTYYKIIQENNGVD
jgi:hypothetical protein